MENYFLILLYLLCLPKLWAISHCAGSDSTNPGHGGGGKTNPNKGVVVWPCQVAAAASLKETCFHPPASGQDATPHPLLRLSGSRAHPNLATEGSPTPATSPCPQFEAKIERNWRIGCFEDGPAGWSYVLLSSSFLPKNTCDLKLAGIYTRRSLLQNIWPEGNPRDASCF